MDKNFKCQKRKIKGKFNLKYITLYWGIISMTSGFMTLNQFETFKFIINKFIKKIGIYNILIHCTKPLTKKSLKTRMGAGKGSIYTYVSCIHPQRLLVEISNISENIIYILTKNLMYKLPFKLQYIKKIIY